MQRNINKSELADSRFAVQAWEEEDVEEESEEEVELTVAAPPSIALGHASKRLAFVNLDWDSIDAKDIYRIANGFAKAEEIVSVRLYKTKYGRAMIEQEEKSGPPIAFSKKNQDQQIREYLKNKMKYCYAVAEFASAEVAESVYEAIDGAEIDETRHAIDVRFVPDEKVIDDELVEETTQPSKLNKKLSKNPLFHTKIHLAWEEDTERERTFRDLFIKGDLDLDLAHELIDASDDEEKQAGYRQVVEEEMKRVRQEQLAGLANDDDDDGDDNEGKEKGEAENGSSELDNSDSAPAKRSTSRRTERLENEVVQDAVSSPESDNEENEPELPEDPRFTQEKSNPDFSVDPTHPQFLAKRRKRS